MAAMWVFVGLTGVVIGWFTWAVHRRARHLSSAIERDEASARYLQLARYQQLRRVSMAVVMAAVLVLAGSLWQVASSSDYLLLPVAAMAIELAVLSIAVMQDAKVRCGQLGIREPAVYARRLAEPKTELGR